MRSFCIMYKINKMGKENFPFFTDILLFLAE